MKKYRTTKNLIDMVNKSNGKTLKIEFIKKGEVYPTEIITCKI